MYKFTYGAVAFPSKTLDEVEGFEKSNICNSSSPP